MSSSLCYLLFLYYKSNAAQAVGELIQIAENKSASEDFKEKHGNRAKFGWYRYDTRFAIIRGGLFQPFIWAIINILKRGDHMAKNVSVYISFLLRHKPESINLEMDNHGWVSVDALINGINADGKYELDLPKLEEIVRQDSKGRYRFNADHSRIKACQGHSLPWVEPEMERLIPPAFLYHGTTTVAVEKIMKSGAISKMSRHAVHMQEDAEKAWQSAIRWHLTPVVLKIDAQKMSSAGFVFGKTENDVWCIESVPIEYIIEQITSPERLCNP